MMEELNKKIIYLLFTDDKTDPHMQSISFGQYIEYFNAKNFDRLGGESYIIFTDKELCRTVLSHFGNGAYEFGDKNVSNV
tara:strand:+ start:87 stop:326 length:240 start_codon:yes stop_codon:yes gene_type:complete